MKLYNILAFFLFTTFAVIANAQQNKEHLAQAEDVERVSTNTINKRDVRILERREGRNYKHKQPKEMYGVKLSKKEYRKRVKEQNFESKPDKKQPNGSSKNKKAKSKNPSKSSK